MQDEHNKRYRECNKQVWESEIQSNEETWMMRPTCHISQNTTSNSPPGVRALTIKPQAAPMPGTRGGQIIWKPSTICEKPKPAHMTQKMVNQFTISLNWFRTGLPLLPNQNGTPLCLIRKPLISNLISQCSTLLVNSF